MSDTVQQNKDISDKIIKKDVSGVPHKHINVACIGNPNCGKTTLFNALTGSKLKVANWPGVTVERFEGHASYEDTEITLIDTPGIYSLTSYSIEEKVTRQCAMDDDIDVIINVVDASSLERNLYLTLQLLELGKPMVLALNMMDIVQERGMEIDIHRLPEMLGDTPVVPVSAAKRTGLGILLHAVIHHYEEGTEEYILDYPPFIEDKIAKLSVMMQAHYPSHSSVRWHAIKLLEDDEEVKREHPISVTNVADKSYEKEIIQSKYTYIESIVKEVLFHKSQKAAATDKIDRLLTHPFWGVPVFLLIMCLVFFLTFTVGDALKGVFEAGLGFVSDGASAVLKELHVAGWLQSLIVEGIIAGVGGILTFVPNIFVPCSWHSGGQRLYGKGSLCDGFHYGKGGAVGEGVPSHDSGFWMYRAGNHGHKGTGDGTRQAQNHAGDPVYVLFGETACLCIVFRYVFSGASGADGIFAVCCGDGDCDSRSAYKQSSGEGEGKRFPADRASGV